MNSFPRPSRFMRTAVVFLTFSGFPVFGSTSIRPDVLLITVDTLRADAVGFVAGHDLTPNIDALAAGGFACPEAVAPAPVTQPSHATIMTGLLPIRHGLRDNGRVLADDLTTLQGRLSQAGWNTAGFVSGYPLARVFGFDLDFAHYDDSFSKDGSVQRERKADLTTTAALEWAKSTAGPRFAWVHYFDPHDPYDPPRTHRWKGPRGAYLGEVAFVDHEIGRLLAEWPSTKPVFVVLAADHGESLGEHGEQTHGFFVYDSTVAVPLLFSWPGKVKPGIAQRPVRLVDVTPTILQVLNLPPLPDSDGVSLVPMFKDPSWSPPPAYVESQRPWASFGWSALVAIRSQRWKLIAAPRPELYDLSNDPAELDNLAAEHPQVVMDLLRTKGEIEGHSVAAASTVTNEQRLALEALGYIGAGEDLAETGEILADPKDRIGVWNKLSTAVAALEAKRFAEAIAAFDEVLQAEPDSPFALSRQGAAKLAAGDTAGAMTALTHALKLRPNDTESRILIARAQMKLGLLSQAATSWRRCLTERPGQADLWEGLAVALGRAGQQTQAADALTECVNLEPRPDRLLRLAFAERSLGRKDQALAHLLAAAASWRLPPFPYPAALGLMLAEAERPDEALPWLRRGRPNEADYIIGQLELTRINAEATAEPERPSE